jgi:hypothetical protein
MSASDTAKQRETVIIDEDTVSDTGANTAVPDTTGAGNMGAGIETSRTPDAPESPQQLPPLSPQQQQPSPPAQQQQRVLPTSQQNQQ